MVLLYMHIYTVYDMFKTIMVILLLCSGTSY